MKYLFVINPISGTGKKTAKVIELINEKFKNSSHDYSIELTKKAGDARKISERAAKEKYDILVAAGGDGTINEAGGGLVDSNTALGIIPMGSGNGLARSYRIPLNHEKSVEYLLKPNIIDVDVGKANDIYFFGVCGMGYDAIIGKKFQDFGTRGPIPYFLIGLREFITYQPEKLELYFNDKKLTVSPLLITISNTEQYGNGAVIAPNANPRDGVFEICIINPMSIFKLLFSVIKMFNQKIREIPQYSQYKIQSVKIVAEDENGVLHTDGEPHNRSKITEIIVLKDALKVCAVL